jgi:predicted GNAT family acetyltransferase
MKKSKYIFHPLTPQRWNDFVKLFGERGACGGCWCMSWILTRKEYDANKGEGNKRMMKKLVDKKTEPGLLAYSGKEPIAWCAIGPRENYIRLENSRVLKRIDEEPVWSIPCFFIKKEFRRKGISSDILKGAIEYCKRKGVKIIEGYPVEPYTEKMPDAFAWTGFPSSFTKAGFVEAARRSRTRPIMRKFL